MSREDRLELFERIAEGLLASYNQVRSAKLDTGLAGGSAETVLVDWIQRWLPLRVAVRNGAVLSSQRGPTTQRDCLLFDQVDSPVYHRLGTADLLPIEGILGAVELNYGLSTGYDKVLKDAAKLSEIADLFDDRLQRAAMPLSHLPLARGSSVATREERIDGLTFHLAHDGKPVLLIFAEELKGSLSECAHRLAEYNKSVGVRKSIDGLFVLRQGYALHLDSQRPGWTTCRLPGAHFGCLSVSEGSVLLKLQTVVLKHLFLGGKTHPEGFDQYVSQTGQGQREVSAAEIASDDEYTKQVDSGAVFIRP